MDPRRSVGSIPAQKGKMIVLQERIQSGAKEEPVETILTTMNNSIYEKVSKQETK